LYRFPENKWSAPHKKDLHVLQSLFLSTLNGLFTTDMNHSIPLLSIMIKKEKADSPIKKLSATNCGFLL